MYTRPNRSLGLADEQDYHYMVSGEAGAPTTAGGVGRSMSNTARERREKKKKALNRRSSSKYEYAGVAPVTDVEKYEELIETLQVEYECPLCPAPNNPSMCFFFG